MGHCGRILGSALPAMWLLFAASAQTFPAGVSQQDAELFETRIRPVLAKSCFGCHGGAQQLSGLRVDSREALLKGGARGPSIVAGDPNTSLLVKSIRHQELKMPIGGKLKDHEILAFEEWIRKGAPWPESTSAKVLSGSDRYRELAQSHWSFQRVKAPVPLPNAKGAETPIDRFILSKLEGSGLAPAKPADRRTLIRRLSYVLTGLPPTAMDVDRFVADKSPDAYERLIDRTLASPRFGEHWARHWLDLVRYGETRGYEWNYEIIGAWRYRDYLVRALNGDVPYDQLLREHIAGDLLKNPRINAAEQINESVIGTAFYRLGEAGHDDCVMFREIALDVVDNQIDTLTKAFQGMTVSCARCHNHKLDPIPTEDYYGLYSILNSSRAVTHTLDLPNRNAPLLSRLRELKASIRQEMASIWTKESKSVATRLLSPALQDRQLASGEKLEDPAYPWTSLRCQTGTQERWLPDFFERLKESYRAEEASRAVFNRENFEIFGNFRPNGSNGWYASGGGLENGSTPSGEFAVAPSGKTALKGILPGGLYTHLLSSRLNGALRTPYLPKTKKYLHVRVMGGSLAARRVVVDNCAIGENYKVLENDAPAWIRLDTLAKEAQLPVFAELVTRWDNPRLPDRPEVLKPHQAKLLNAPYSYFGITDAVLSDSPETPRETLSHMLRLFEGQPGRTWEQLAGRYESAVAAAVDRWAAGTATDDDVRWLDWSMTSGLLSNQADSTPRLAGLIAEYRSVEAQIPEPRVVEGLADMGPGKDYPVLVSGNAKNPGQPAPRRFLQEVFGKEPMHTEGSGRRELADMVASVDNPLTARVMVNRIWSYVFGRGLVASVDNFGLLGDRPTHAELLDHLATEFVQGGWSIKKLTRLMLTSGTFRQSGEIAKNAKEIDPENKLLHHYPLRRLEAESIRDTILQSSGKLKENMFGPSLDPYRDQAKDYRKLFSGPLDGAGRRSLYLKVTRMEGTRFLDMFDYPSAMATRGSRDVTNVPAQSLTLLNDPFVIAEAEACAKKLTAQSASSVEERIRDLFRTVLRRSPDAAETERFRGLAAELGSLRSIRRDEILDNVEIWKDLAHAVFNLKEFIYVQ